MQWEIPCAEVSAANRRSYQTFSTETARPHLSPVLGLCLRMIDSAFSDALECEGGQPTETAVTATDWLLDDVFKPGSFLWACHWLGISPAHVREHGLARPKGGSWRGYSAAQGLPAVFECWELARAKTANSGKESEDQVP